jgi:hypothetical protein
MTAPAIISVPASPGNYGQLISPLPSDIMLSPNEGQLVIPLNFDWSGASGDIKNGATQVNLTNRQLRGFSGIRGMFVDNSQSGADVTFIVPATQFEFTVPAGTGGMFPVCSQPGTLQFYVVSPMAIAGDKTFAQVFNYLPFPVDISRPTFQSVASFSSLSLTGNGSQALVNAGVNGTLQNLSLLNEGSIGGGGSGVASIKVQDGSSTPVIFVIVGLTLGNAQSAPPEILYTQSGLSQRFVNGLNVVVTATGTAFANGAVAVNASYRVP